ncbi:DUF4625 domain-containing protein [Porphyromonas pogonae]|uniref:DUF4625 domain-containing protein n=1 Tax=Porphyromonas pogonae TaxID=867595 RepID=UPI002E788728|nr:DUF4625 domain-containing protein [Porphyromonas pogonae]
MKAKILMASLFATILFGTVFTSCSKDDIDSEKPKINLIEPENGDKLQIGKDVHFEMDLSDNVMIKSYKIDIHNNFDNHSHGKAEEGKPFQFNKTWEVGQKTAHVHHHDIVIPAGVKPGKYHFMVYCVDTSGNESFVVRDVELTTENVPHDH